MTDDNDTTSELYSDAEPLPDDARIVEELTLADETSVIHDAGPIPESAFPDDVDPRDATVVDHETTIVRDDR
jgi:hypothetical protein